MKIDHRIPDTKRIFDGRCSAADSIFLQAMIFSDHMHQAF